MVKTTSISWKLTRLNIFVSAAALSIASIALLLYDQASYKRLLIDNVSAQADVVGQNSVSALIFNDPESARSTVTALESVPTVLAASLFTARGDLFASYSRAPGLEISDKLDPLQTTATLRIKRRDVIVTRPLRSGDKIAGYLIIRADLSGIDERLKRYLIIIGAVLALSLLAALAVSAALRRVLTRPIVELANVAQIVSRERNYSIRATPTHTHDEISVLVTAFNEMLAGIQNRDMALDTQRARLQAILDNAPVGILVVEAASRQTILANKTVMDLLHEPLGITAKAHSDWRIMRSDREIVEIEERPLIRALRGETVVGEEYIVSRVDGSETWVRASAAPVREKHGDITAGLLVLVGIDDQKKAQMALLQSKKLAAAGRLAASISHEINNPLASVTNLLYIALSDNSLTSDVRNLLLQADQELARVSHIATQTLRFYRQSTNPTAVEMGTVIDSVLQLLTGRLRNTDVTVLKDYTALTPITCFEGELRQVFTNLVSNAIDATAGRTARLSIRTKELHSSKADGGGVQITIADNGHGIAAEFAQRIFEPFYTTKGSRGTGLGLWVTQEIVAKHKGTIRVKSKVNCGTVFVVFIPFNAVAERMQAVHAVQRS